MMALGIFAVFIAFLFGLSWYLGRKSASEEGFFVAGGQIHWFVNGIALTGGYLSAASFLGICGMIAFKGFDGYLYSIGFLSGWIVALFVVAEPLRRLGKYTFADALGARFESRGIHLAAGISTLIISMCYLVPQMVGAGVLIEPLLGIAHHWGVILVGAVVIVIVASAGMSSTTYVQFIKASMLIVLSTVLVAAVCGRGLETGPDTKGFLGETVPHYRFETIPVQYGDDGEDWSRTLSGTPYAFAGRVQDGDNAQTWILLAEWTPLLVEQDGVSYITERRGRRLPVLRDPEGAVADMIGELRALPEDDANVRELERSAMQVAMRKGVPHIRIESWWRLEAEAGGAAVLLETQNVTKLPDGDISVNGLPADARNPLLPMGRIAAIGERAGYEEEGTPVGPMDFLAVFSDPETKVELPRSATVSHDGREVALYYHHTVAGNELMRPGGHFNLSEPWSRLDFISLMLALFCGTSALPHVLIRYYTVKDSRAARKSTIVAITAIGAFYILTLFLGLGAIASGVLNPQTDNMSAPLLARSFGESLFAAITALAFATVLGTVSGLIVAASGAVANDILDRYMKRAMTGRTKVVAAKVTAVTVGIVSVVLGILFRGVNVGFLVGWAFAVAASANFPAIIMVLFWKRTTAAGVISSILVGTVAALGIILLGPDMFALYGFGRAAAWAPLGQPALLSMPISFLTLVAVSLATGKGANLAERKTPD